MDNKRFMRRAFSNILAAAVAVGTVFAPLAVQADDLRTCNVHNYGEWPSSQPNEIWLYPETDFGWPGTKTVLDLNTYLNLYGNWSIPANITVNQHFDTDTNGLDRYEGRYYNIDLYGTWNMGEPGNSSGGGNNLTLGSMTAKAGSVLNIGKPDGTDSMHAARIGQRLTVESGANVNVNSMLQLFEGSQLIVKNGAVVNKGFRGEISLSGGALHGEGGRLASLQIDDGSDEMQKRKSSITGSVAVDNLYLCSDLAIPSGTTLTVDGLLYCRNGWGESCTLTVESGATLNLGGNFQYGKIIAKKGSAVNIVGRNLRMGNGGEDTASLVLDGVTVNASDGRANLAIAKGSSVAGNGTLHFGSANSAVTGDGTVAGTVTIAHDGNCIYESSGKDAACILCGKKNTASGSGNTGNNGTTDGSTSVTAKEPKKGASLKVNGVTYKVTKTGTGRTVTVSKTPKKTKVTIPSKVMYNGRSYSVSAIASKAFYKNTKIASVTIPASVKTVGTQSFYKCTKLKSAVIGKNVASIGKQAFYGCKSLKTVTVKTTKLTAKKVGSKAFAGIYSKATVRVPKSKLKTYKKLLVSKGISRKAKIKK